MSGHTPEPWYVFPPQDDSEKWIAVSVDNVIDIMLVKRGPILRDDPEDIGDRNADRVVACVNACKGMDDPAKEIAELRAANAKMLKALELVKDRWVHPNQIKEETLLGMVYAAIAKAKGETR